METLLHNSIWPFVDLLFSLHSKWMSISLTCEASERWQDLAAVSQSLQCLAKHPFVGTCLMTSHASIRLISIKEVQVYSVGEGMKRGQRKPSISFNIEFFTHRMEPEKAARFATEFVDLFIVTAPEKAGPRTGCNWSHASSIASGCPHCSYCIQAKEETTIWRKARDEAPIFVKFGRLVKFGRSASQDPRCRAEIREHRLVLSKAKYIMRS